MNEARSFRGARRRPHFLLWYQLADRRDETQDKLDPPHEYDGHVRAPAGALIVLRITRILKKIGRVRKVKN